jgi:hypothetical protein
LTFQGPWEATCQVIATYATPADEIATSRRALSIKTIYTVIAAKGIPKCNISARPRNQYLYAKPTRSTSAAKDWLMAPKNTTSIILSCLKKNKDSFHKYAFHASMVTQKLHQAEQTHGTVKDRIDG